MVTGLLHCSIRRNKLVHHMTSATTEHGASVMQVLTSLYGSVHLMCGFTGVTAIDSRNSAAFASCMSTITNMLYVHPQRNLRGDICNETAHAAHLHIPRVRCCKWGVELRLHLQNDMGRFGAEHAESLLGVGAICGAWGPTRYKECTDGLIQQEVLLHPVDALSITGQL